MKKTPIKSPKSTAKPVRGESDNLCKRLAEEYPEQFAHWLFGASGKVKVEKTELSREPVRADSVIFSHDEDETLHADRASGDARRSTGRACWRDCVMIRA